MKRYFIPVKCRSEDCPQFERCCRTGTIVEEREGRVDVLIVGDSAEAEDAQKKVPFMGPSGRLLRNVVSQENTRGYGVAYSNVCRAYPKNAGVGRPPNKQEIEFCIPYLLRDIRRLKPRVVVLLGNIALAAVTGMDPKEVRIGQHRGKFAELEIKDNSYSYTSTYHPNHVMRNTNLVMLFMSDLEGVFSPIRQIEAKKQKKVTCTLIKTLPDLKELVDYFLYESKGPTAFDYETLNLNKRYGNKILSLQLSDDGMIGYTIPYLHRQTPFDSTELKVVKKEMIRLYTTTPRFKYWIAHHSQFEIIITLQCLNTIIQNATIMDTMSMAHLLDENRLALRAELGGTYSLKLLTREWLGWDVYDRMETALGARAAGDMNSLTLDELNEYGGTDPCATWRLYYNILEQAEEQDYRKKLFKMAKYFCAPAHRQISIMEYNGFQIDMSHLYFLKDRNKSPIHASIEDIHKSFRKNKYAKKTNSAVVRKKKGKNLKMKALFKEEWLFDISKASHQDNLFFEQMKLEPVETGKSGKASVGKKFQEKYGKIPEVATFMEFQSLKKMRDSYINAVFDFVNPETGSEDCKDGRVRPSFSLTRTVTGRSNCENPNLQQLPGVEDCTVPEKEEDRSEEACIKGTVGCTHFHPRYYIKKMYTAPKGRCLIQLDFMASEVRVWAILARCAVLAQAFIDAKKFRDEYRANPFDKELKKMAELAGDVHKVVAAGAWQVSLDQVKKDQRKAAKNIVFGYMYKRGMASIGEQIGNKDLDWVKETIRKIFDRYVRAEQWMFEQEDFSKEHGFVESPIGRRRRLDSLLIMGSLGDGKAEYDAQSRSRNSPIQSFSSDQAYIGASLFSDWILENGVDWTVQSVVHDSCIFELDIDDIEKAIKVAEKCFTTDTMEYISKHWGLEYNCPIEVEFEIGKHMADLEKWDFSPKALKRIVKRLRK